MDTGGALQWRCLAVIAPGILVHLETCLSSDEALSLKSLQCHEMADAGLGSAHVIGAHSCCLPCRQIESVTT